MLSSITAWNFGMRIHSSSGTFHLDYFYVTDTIYLVILIQFILSYWYNLSCHTDTIYLVILTQFILSYWYNLSCHTDTIYLVILIQFILSYWYNLSCHTDTIYLVISQIRKKTNHKWPIHKRLHIYVDFTQQFSHDAKQLFFRFHSRCKQSKVS